MTTAPTHLLFDFFGTLVTYSESRVEQGFQASYDWLQSAGVQITYAEFLDRWEATFQVFEGDAQRDLDEYSMDAVCEAFLQHVLGHHPGARALATFRDIYLTEWNKGVRYLPGVTEMLARLADRFTLVLVTNTHHPDLVRGHLAAMAAAPFFAAVITSVEHGKRKPSRSIFDHALERTGGAPETSIYVGDSFSSDYQGATGAGLRCLLIDPERLSGAPESDRLSHVLELADRMGSGVAG